jgi:hypothetical protein
MSRNNFDKDFLNGLSLRDLRKRLNSDFCEIKDTLSDIEKLLRLSERVLKQLLQTGITNQESFFNVAHPAAPPDAPPAVTPTPIVQIIAKDIARIARQIRIQQQELTIWIFNAFLGTVFLQSAETEEAEISALVFLFAAVGRIGTIKMELQSLRDELEANIALLLAFS